MIASDHRSRSRIAAAIILAGGLRPSPLARAAARSVLDLHLTESGTVLDAWIAHVEALLRARRGVISIRVLCDKSAPEPNQPTTPGERASVEFEREASAYRGPAGALRDACARYDADDQLLIIEGARWATGSLLELADAHKRRAADITVGCDQSDRPTGIYLLRAAVLQDLVPSRGFMDLKEQLLARAMEAGLGIWVHRSPDGCSIPLRTRSQFLEAAAAATRIELGAGGGASENPGRPAFRVITPGARVAPDSVIADAVVMPDAEVGSGAVVARSIVCPGARVASGTEIVDQVVRTGGVESGDDSSDPRRWKHAV